MTRTQTTQVVENDLQGAEGDGLRWTVFQTKFHVFLKDFLRREQNEVAFGGEELQSGRETKKQPWGGPFPVSYIAA